MNIKQIPHFIHPARNLNGIIQLHKETLLTIKDQQPTYFPFERSSPNFLKINNLHPQSIVTGSFIQYNFFPWNPESQSVFSTLKTQISLLVHYTDAYCKNKYNKSYLDLTGLDNETMYNEKFFFRVAYQCFPASYGFLSLHRDPIGEHQICAPIVNLTPIKERGLYYILNDECHCVQKLLDYGDTIFFDSSRLHGVSNDLTSLSGTEHFLISVHSYHNLTTFKPSYLH